MKTLNHLKSALPSIEKQLGVRFDEPSHLLLAFIHPSFVNESQAKEDNQRLEFLGDAVLGLIAADYLYSHFPSLPEGEMSNLRAALVDTKACASYVAKLEIAPYMLMSQGEQMQPARGKSSLMADLFESLIGALYLDGGLDKARSFIFTHFGDEIQAMIANPPRNFKAELQDYSQKKFGKPPEYLTVKEEGPDHARIFCVKVSAGKIEGIGSGPSKKIAQQQAAQSAMESLDGKS